MQENVSAIRVVKAYVREKFESEKFRKASENVRNLLMRAELIIAWNAPFMQLTVYSCILLISWMGARLIVSSGATTFTTGDLMSMLSYCMNILMSLMMLSMVFVMITMSAASAKRVAEVLDEKSDLTNGENPVMDVKDGSVKFDHVSFLATQFIAQVQRIILLLQETTSKSTEISTQTSDGEKCQHFFQLNVCIRFRVSSTFGQSDGCMSDTPETMGGLSGVPNGTSSQTI